MPDRSSPVLGSFASSFRRSRDGAEAPRNSLDYSSMNSSRWFAAGYEDVPFGIEIPSFRDRSLLFGNARLSSSQASSGRKPSVVARLMGLDMFPLETIASKPERLQEEADELQRLESSRGRVQDSRRNFVTSDQNRGRCSRKSARELLDAMRLSQASNGSFLDFLSEKARLRMEDASSKVELEHVRRAPGSFPSRIVVLKPSPRIKSEQGEELPEKILHVVAQTRQLTSAKDFPKEQLCSDSSNAKDIAQAIVTKARDKFFTSENAPTSRLKQPRASLSSSHQLNEENRHPLLTRSRSEKLPDSQRTQRQAKTKPSVQKKFHNLESFDYKERQTERAARALDFSSVCSSSVVTTYKDVRKADMVYTWKVIFSILSHSSTGFSWIRNSMLSTRIFQSLELDYQSTGGSSVHRRLLFDVVGEIIARKHHYFWNSSVLSRQRLMREVWGELSRSTELAKDSSREKILSSEAIWPGPDEELHKLGVNLSREIFSSLINEAAFEFLEQNRVHDRKAN